MLSTGERNGIKALAGFLTFCAILLVFFLAAGLFLDSFRNTVPITVITDRAGLVMNPDARVKLNEVQVGKVSSIEPLPNGNAALHLAIDPASVQIIPANIGAEITSSTVFGAKFVELLPPSDPSSDRIRPGAVIHGGDKVTVELNTVFEKLVSVLSKIEPVKLNQTLGALAQSLTGRGNKFGQALEDLDSALAKINPGLENLNHDLAVAPVVLDAYADAAPDLVAILDNATAISDTVVDQQDSLDALLLSAIGFADIGTDVLSTNRQPLADVVHLLAPTTDLTNQYNPAITCGLKGVIPLATGPGTPVPGSPLLQSFFFGRERYRYPDNLPKVAAKGGPQCTGLPEVAYEQRPPFVVTDIGANQAQYGNQGILLNSDALKQALFGPIAGPPRNSAQMGQPG